MQGFAMLLNGTMSSEDENERLLKMCIKAAHVARHIANADPIHRTQDCCAGYSSENDRFHAGWCGPYMTVLCHLSA
jgi:hypothetical protein